jgi:aspartyl aminopeptidase
MTQNLNTDLIQFLKNSPTPFHAVSQMASQLVAAGFIELFEQDAWSLEPGKTYFVIRNGSALVAFKTGNEKFGSTGFRLAGTHTDSPCLKVKPSPEIAKNGYLQLGVEVYGGALLSPWFDRDLSLAGRVHFLNDKGTIESALVNFLAPIAFIPSLAIHLNRDANEGRKINAQQELPPVLLQTGDSFSLDELLLTQLKTSLSETKPARVLSHELFFYDTQSPALVGVHSQFLASARLDNLLSCFVACRSLIDSNNDHASVLVCNDHEEVGSMSTTGAQGPLLKSVLERALNSLNKTDDALARSIHQSLMLSIDNAHGVHPNYVDRHDDQHKPLLNAGPVIKLNANQRYASNSHSVASFIAICDAAKVPYQSFVMRTDMACGSTIGPITASGLGVETVDIGVATFGMHSIRELAGAQDPELLGKAVTKFYSR